MRFVSDAQRKAVFSKIGCGDYPSERVLSTRPKYVYDGGHVKFSDGFVPDKDLDDPGMAPPMRHLSDDQHKKFANEWNMAGTKRQKDEIEKRYNNIDFEDVHFSKSTIKEGLNGFECSTCGEIIGDEDSAKVHDCSTDVSDSSFSDSSGVIIEESFVEVEEEEEEEDDDSFLGL